MNENASVLVRRAETVVRMLRREADGAASYHLVEITPALLRELADLIEGLAEVPTDGHAAVEGK